MRVARTTPFGRSGLGARPDPRPRPLPGPVRPARRGTRGLTLIELTITVAVIGLVAAMAVVSVQALGHSHLRSTSVEIAGAIKQSYDRAIMEKRLQRIAFDLDEHAWWVEYTDDPYALDVERLGTDEEEREEEELFLDEDTPEEVRAALEGGRAASFSPDPDFPEKMPLPGAVHFGRAWTGMREDPFEEGVVYLHFFRGGFTEPLQLELYDGHPDAPRDTREYVTIKVRPLTGRVKMYQEQLEPPEDEGRMWEEEDR
jgi:prepilin-type N-terminal cleavage/methylation domain-containing protein